MRIERTRPSSNIASWNNLENSNVGYENLTFIASGNISVSRNGTTSVNFFKTSGSAGWDNHAYCATPFTAPCTIEFTKRGPIGFDNGRSYAMIGWNVDPTTDPNYTSLDYAAYPYRQDLYEIYNNGTYISNPNTWSEQSKFYIVYDTDGFLYHYNGSKLLYSVNYGTGKTVYVDTSLHSPHVPFGGFSDVRVTRAAWNGYNYVRESPIPRSGLQLMLDAQDSASAYTGYTLWSDLSGNARNFNVTSSALRTASNGFKYMDFNGSYGCAKSASDYGALANGAFTVIAFSKISTNTSNWRTLMRGYANDHQVIIDTSNNLGMYDNDSAGFLTSGYNVTTNPLTSTWNLLVWRMNTSSPFYSFSINNSSSALGTITNSNATYTRGFGSIGAYHDGNTTPSSASQYWGFINGFMVYNRHISEAEQQQIYSFFNQRSHIGV